MTHKILIQVTISHLLSLCSLRTLRFKSHLFNRRGAEYAEVRGEKVINFLKFSPTLTGLGGYAPPMCISQIKPNCFAIKPTPLQLFSTRLLRPCGSET
ncbi:hypothetical protein DA73_0400011720 [Tolypothrix bouteillei VB521301]|uniref:Uncharacterized protein n=1 Tax=Tolypothrix bouteillei VB521301 TaxID=1479485 RepID=A0A8S9T3A2_9CYAN|nr:hypothetical protein DA73_0400011720 [Tolypothrix bouteillei VB521301]